MNNRIYTTLRSEKKIRAGVIYNRVRDILDPGGTIGVDVDDDLAKFFVGADPALIIPDMINESRGFRGDGIMLSVAQMRGASKVSHVIAAVIREYKASDWIVYI